jgi:predicted RNA methylase
MTVLTVVKDAPAVAVIISRRLLALRQSLGFWGTVRYFAGGLRELPQRTRLLIDDGLYDHKMGLETSRLVKLADLGLDAAQLDAAHSNASGFAYIPTPPRRLAAIFAELDIRHSEYTFIELGSGMGRVVFGAAAYPFHKVVGVEFSPELHTIAMRNLSNISHTVKAADIELLCQDAQDYTYPPGNCVVYLFNPFREPVLRTVLDNLRRAFATSDAELYVLYMHPVLGELLAALPFLSMLKRTREYVVYRSISEDMRTVAAEHSGTRQVPGDRGLQAR